MLAQVLLPGRNAEDLDKTIRPLSVAVHLPARTPSPESRPPELAHRLQEGWLPLWCDGVVDDDEHRSAPWLRVEGQPCISPVDGGLDIKVVGFRHAQDRAASNPDQHAPGCEQNRGLQAEPVGSQAPQQGADRVRTHECDRVHRETSRADPGWQHELKLDLV